VRFLRLLGCNSQVWKRLRRFPALPGREVVGSGRKRLDVVSTGLLIRRQWLRFFAFRSRSAGVVQHAAIFFWDKMGTNACLRNNLIEKLGYAALCILCVAGAHLLKMFPTLERLGDWCASPFQPLTAV
jgi:hypothetical protein